MDLQNLLKENAMLDYTLEMIMGITMQRSNASSIKAMKGEHCEISHHSTKAGMGEFKITWNFDEGMEIYESD
jgi:hypothetical protein